MSTMAPLYDPAGMSLAQAESYCGLLADALPHCQVRTQQQRASWVVWVHDGSGHPVEDVVLRNPAAVLDFLVAQRRRPQARP